MPLSTPKLLRKMAMLAAIEVTKGTEVVPVAANALLVKDVTLTPLEGDEVSNDFIKPYFGNSGTTLVTEYSKASFSVPFSGVGALGDVPGYSALLRACACAMTTSAGASVTFAPVTDGIESVTLHANIDGTLHKMIGAHGTATASVDAKGIPVWKFEFTGSFRPATDTLLPAVTYATWKDPFGVNKNNTTLSLHGMQVACSSFQFDIGNTGVKQDLINVDTTEITGRSSKGSVTIRNTSIAEKDWIAAAREGLSGALHLVHGPNPTNVVEIKADRVRVGKPSYSEQDGIQMIQIPLSFIPSDEGNDEWELIVH